MVLSLHGVDFSFEGFSADRITQFESSIKSIRLIDRPLRLTEARAVTLIPPVPQADGRFLGGAFAGDGSPVPDTPVVRSDLGLVFGNKLPAPSEIVHEVIPRAIYGGMLFSGYGHIVLESAARLWSAKLAVDLPVLIMCTPKVDGRAIFCRIAEALGIDPDRIIFVDSPTLVDHLLVPEAGLSLGREVNLRYVQELHSMLNRQASLFRGYSRHEQAPSPCYLSRSGMQSRQRRGFGERDLESALYDHGVFVVRPELLTFSSQLAIVNEHDTFAGLIGSQFHNFLFRANSRALSAAYLCSESPNVNFFQLDLLFPGARVYANVASFEPFFEFGNRAPFRIDEEVAGRALSTLGMLPRRSNTLRNSRGANPETYAYGWSFNFFYYKAFRRYVMGGNGAPLMRDAVGGLKKRLGADFQASEREEILRAFDECARLYRLSDDNVVLSARRELAVW